MIKIKLLSHNVMEEVERKVWNEVWGGISGDIVLKDNIKLGYGSK